MGELRDRGSSKGSTGQDDYPPRRLTDYRLQFPDTVTFTPEGGFAIPENQETALPIEIANDYVPDGSSVIIWTLASGNVGFSEETYILTEPSVPGSSRVDDSVKVVPNSPLKTAIVIINDSGTDNTPIYKFTREIAYGDKNDNFLFGSEGDDRLLGDDGNDFLNGGGGNDILAGENGKDSLNGGRGVDILTGGSEDDTLNGGRGNDILYGDYGNDILNGGRGNDKLNGHVGKDTLQGNAGNDYLDGYFNDDYLDGGNDNDILDGWSGSDTLYGGNGEDTLLGGVANAGGPEYDKDLLFGGDGNDSVLGEGGNDTLTGGAGADKFVFNSLTEGIDTITDFKRSEGDKIEVSAVRFGIGQGEFDKFTFNASTGALFFEQTQLATLQLVSDFAPNLDISIV